MGTSRPIPTNMNHPPITLAPMVMATTATTTTPT